LAAAHDQGISFGRQRRASGTNQFIRFDENVVIVRLFSCKVADGYKRRAKQQAHEHYFSVRALISIMK
jgi:hypothetical protein